MSFDVRDLQDLSEREPVAAAALWTNCIKHSGCTDWAGAEGA
ncbi:hypothetical protein [Nonomuraea sp. NPDC049480]